MNDTTRRYPRTMQEAFPKDYFQWMEGPVKYQVDSDIVMVPVVTFFAGLLLGLVLCR
jgi:hypothetical protein